MVFCSSLNRSSGNEKLPTPSLIPLRCYDGLKVFHTLTSTILIYIFWPRAVCHTFCLALANFEAREKIPTLWSKLENYESVQRRLQFSGIKKGAKSSFHRHFKYMYQLEFPEEGWNLRKNLFVGGGMSIFKNYTIQNDCSFQEHETGTYHCEKMQNGIVSQFMSVLN